MEKWNKIDDCTTSTSQMHQLTQFRNAEVIDVVFLIVYFQITPFSIIGNASEIDCMLDNTYISASNGKEYYCMKTGNIHEKQRVFLTC